MSNSSKVQLVLRLISNIQSNLDQVKGLVEKMQNDQGGKIDWSNIALSQEDISDQELGQIVEGVFDGRYMVGSDGRQYIVPPNYASKSKLVEGDILKLTIKPDGVFLYKPIKPISRERVRGILVRDKESEEYRVLVGEKLYRVLLASVTYFKGKVGDEVILLVSEGGACKWGAVENIIPNQSVGNEQSENTDSWYDSSSSDDDFDDDFIDDPM